MDRDTWALKLGKLATEAKERRTAAAAAQSREGTRGETVRQTRARMQAEEERLLAEEARRQEEAHRNSLSNAIVLEALPENPALHEFEHLDSEMAGLQAQIDSLQSEKSKLQSDNAELTREILSLRGHVEGLENTITSLRDELAALRTHVQSQGTARKTAALHVTQQMHRKRSK